MTDLIHEEALTHLALCKINGEDYNPRDNTTFRDAPLAYSPHQDIAIRLALEEKHKKKSRGYSLTKTTRGDFLAPVMPQGAGENNVLQFPPAKEFKTTVKIKTVKVGTPLPPSLVRRYKCEANPFYMQSVPIFFNTKQEHFFAPLDRRFADKSEIAHSDYDVFLNAEHISTEGRKYFVVKDKTLSGVIEKLEALYRDKSFKRNYKNYFVDFEKAERVIVLEFDRKKSDEDPDSGLLRGVSVNPLIERQSANWSYYQAAKVGNTLYLMNEDGDIDKANTLRYDEEEFVSSLEPISKSIESAIMRDKRNIASLIMPYSEASWRIVTGLHHRLNALFDEIQKVLLATKNSVGELDKPLSEVQLNFALTDKTKGQA